MVRLMMFASLCASLATPIVFAQTTDGNSTQDVFSAPDDLSELDELDLLSRTESDDEFPEIAAQIERKPVSVTVRALNKVTAKFIDINIAINDVVEFGSLEIKPRYCDKRPPEEFPETSAFLQIFDRGLGKKADKGEAEAGWQESAAIEPVLLDQSVSLTEPTLAAEDDADPRIGGEPVFSGWMFASSPALNPLEHAVYDVWVIDCETVAADNQ